MRLDHLAAVILVGMVFIGGIMWISKARPPATPVVVTPPVTSPLPPATP